MAGNAGDAERRAEHTLIPAALARRHDIADGGLRRDNEATAAESLDDAAGDEEQHRSAEAAERRANQKDPDGGLEYALPPIQISELSVQRNGDRLGEEVGRHDPRQALHAPELSHDRRQGGGDNRRIERRE